MPKNLVIVESPAKAKTIEQYLGKDFSVKSSFGHVRDLPKKGLNIDIEHDFKPSYEISPDKTKVVRELKKAASGLEVWLATDEDREGEAIAWHLCEALGLKPAQTKRIVFHEITKSALEAAVAKPRTVDINLVDAQQARRILDRLVGYELSPVLWKKVRTGLSAGRVQSVAVRLIVEREREIKGHQAEANFKVVGTFYKDKDFEAELSKRLESVDKTKELLEAAKTAQFKVSNIDQKPGSRSPGSPFTTSLLQQEAARKLGYSVKQTMTLAQRLYESGHITYMRTDSTILSSLALTAAKKYITNTFGANYHHERQFQTKNKSAQEAHEAIRPTSFDKLSAGNDEQQTKLYQLIWRRAIASQMAPATIDKTDLEISMSNRSETLIAKGEVLKFDGFFKVYGGSKEDVILPQLKVGDALDLKAMSGTQTFTKPAARYSEASLVRKLEELGIGRPSTYAPTISTIQARGYVEKSDVIGQERDVTVIRLEKGNISEVTEKATVGADRNKLLPTSVAEVTTDFLVKHFSSIVDYDFTAHAEKELDDIAEGKESKEQMLKDFYKRFHPLVEKSESVSREETSQARELGKDPTSGKPIIARFGRYGPMLQRGATDDEAKPDFAPLPKDATLETVTVEQALEMFKLPRVVGKTESGEEIKANIGRFGPYIQVDKTFVSLKEHDPLTINEADARKLYAEKQKQEAEKNIAEFPSGIKVLNGPYGPYITNGKKNARIPKSVDPKKLTEVEAKDLLDKAPDKKARFRRRKKT
ncbi:MAG TPA: type I DNA topoisomerase [Candidatus Saccharimonadales bacterium]|nr:type I DNA topoisomerase [Candidatus Saccharimonadales bacterium]